VEHTASEPTSQGARSRYPWRFAAVDDRQLAWLLEAGLGPALYRALGNAVDCIPAAWRQMLLSADLTARIRHAKRVDCAVEIIDACENVGVRPTLLKGISISDQHYPVPHVRPMGDIDVLIPPQDYQSVESAILLRGYDKSDYSESDGQHHGPPLHHPERDVWVELHTVLYPRDSPLRAGTLFSPARVASRTAGSMFGGKPVDRLLDELQLVYIASSWMNDLIRSRVQPSFLASLFDAIHLLKAKQQTLDWDRLLGWLDNEIAAASVYVMLAYLPRFGITPMPPSTMADLGARQRIVGAINLRLIHAMLDHYLIRGRRWNLPVPPPVPGRYSARYQWRKRVIDRLRRP
jgi:hypothetical protein